jgi:hypothetical protein
MKRIIILAIRLFFVLLEAHYFRETQQATVIWDGWAHAPESFTSRQMVAETWAAAHYVSQQIWCLGIWIFCWVKLGD